MANTTNTAGATGTLDQSVNTILSEFKLLSQEMGKVKNAATRYTLQPHSGLSKNVNNYGQLTASSIGEAVDIVQAQALADFTTSYTPSEVAVQVIVPDTVIRRVADPALMKNVGRMASNAYELKEDKDGCLQFSSFTSTLGSSGTVATVGHLMAADAKLRIGSSTATPEPAPDPLYFFGHPNSLYPVMSRLIPLAAGPGATAGGAAGVMGAMVAQGETNDQGMQILAGKGLNKLFRLYVMDDANVPLSGTDAVNCAFSKEGLIYVSEFEPTPRRERDESLRAEEINFVGSYVFGVYRPAAYGLAVTLDASTPTS